MTRLCRCSHARPLHQQWTWGGYLKCTKCLCPRWRWVPAVIRWLLAGPGDYPAEAAAFLPIDRSYSSW